MNIGTRTIEVIKGMAAEQLDTYAAKINEAFLKSDDGKLKVSLAIDIGMSEKPNSLDIDVTIGFTADKVKEKVSKTVCENQVEMFEGARKAVERMRPKAGSGIDSVTISTGGDSVTLGAK